MTCTAMPCDAIADPEMTAERVRRLLGSMGKRQALLRTIAAAPRRRTPGLPAVVRSVRLAPLPRPSSLNSHQG